MRRRSAWRDVVHSIDTWRMANTRGDHEMSDLTGFLEKISTGTKLVAKASDRPLTRHKTECVQDGLHKRHMKYGTVR